MSFDLLKRLYIIFFIEIWLNCKATSMSIIIHIRSKTIVQKRKQTLI